MKNETSAYPLSKNRIGLSFAIKDNERTTGSVTHLLLSQSEAKSLAVAILTLIEHQNPVKPKESAFATPSCDEHHGPTEHFKTDINRPDWIGLLAERIHREWFRSDPPCAEWIAKLISSFYLDCDFDDVPEQDGLTLRQKWETQRDSIKIFQQEQMALQSKLKELAETLERRNAVIGRLSDELNISNKAAEAMGKDLEASWGLNKRLYDDIKRLSSQPPCNEDRVKVYNLRQQLSFLKRELAEISSKIQVVQ